MCKIVSVTENGVSTLMIHSTNSKSLYLYRNNYYALTTGGKYIFRSKVSLKALNKLSPEFLERQYKNLHKHSTKSVALSLEELQHALS